MSAESRELTREERAAIRKLVVSMCANYDAQYGCLPLDCSCYMLGKWWTGSYCKYFRSAVLPLDPMLEAPATGICSICGQPIMATNNRAKYCASCANRERRKRQREYMRKRKAGN